MPPQGTGEKRVPRGLLDDMEALERRRRRKAKKGARDEEDAMDEGESEGGDAGGEALDLDDVWGSA